LHWTLSARRLVGRAAIAGIAVAAVFALGSTQAFASVAAHPTINTFPKWDGVTVVHPFGCADTTTYGQVITIPAGKTHLNKYGFKWKNDSANLGRMIVRGEVYKWDGSKATGAALSETAPRRVRFTDSAYHAEAFASGAAVTAGAQYVIFVSIDKDYEKCTNNYEVDWAAIADDNAYPGGTFVYQNNGGDESQWTATPWSSFGWDLAFKAYLS
jgi:hypothetical protein